MFLTIYSDELSDSAVHKSNVNTGICHGGILKLLAQNYFIVYVFSKFMINFIWVYKC